jgi:hypothetical protein
MRNISILLILIFSVFGTACDNEIIENVADFEFETVDKNSNKVNLSVMVRYRLKSRLQKKASKKYGRHYKDSLLLPVISSISEIILKNYSAGESIITREKKLSKSLVNKQRRNLQRLNLN